ncbi:MAG TPA: hypothetical protein VFI34_08685 [Candidatus Limnocylindrales bacterium]|nr:hypothetical protein [Candidatus Limnocylindrales bacterium]
MAQLQAVWAKLNPRERLSAIGAGVILLGWLIGLISVGVGASTLALLGALIVLGVYYVKYTPTMKVNWPADPVLIVLAVSALVAIAELIDLLRLFPYLSYAGYFGGGVILSILLAVVGAALMVWGGWQEYQVAKPELPEWAKGAGGAAGSATTTPPAASAAPSAPAGPAAPMAPPPAMDDHDEAPPA